MLAAMNPPCRDWSGRRVWLIGASSGIGAALAEGLMRAGARVALTARNAARLQALANPAALVLPFDATEPVAWAEAFATLQAQWGGVDLLVFCAADYRPERACDVRADRVARTLETNLGSVYYGLEAVLPTMLREKTGGIALVASVAGYVGLPGAAVYGPSKAALINLAELLYAELRQHALPVYLINPGFVATRLTAKNDFPMPALQTPEQAAHHILRGVERGRFEIHFPYRFTLWIKLLRLLPYRIRLPLLRRLARP
ncbi:SDR family NAD(P)-dependent oxidoreductase [Jeongeupia chitinilytica]|uniref:Short-chain dehydrogenase n=1 Tax=Jeongeupia chitinilytica TaxID=1041641 RepID=A0ABQ3H142_9NEIS|nr:SDR family NAD(P)-dependent oxidoreductase [Jeongeupia chitinilytica]GHD64269.1 short-chain dehydrogenase [Jeongeupia chitinilytica]